MDNQQGTVQEVLNGGKPIKEGMGKNGKPYAKYKILTEQGITAFGFGPVSANDKVTIWDDEQWGIQFKVQRPDRHEEVMKALKFIAAQNKQILEAISNATSGSPENADHPAPQPIKAESTTPAADPLKEKLKKWEKSPPSKKLTTDEANSLLGNEEEPEWLDE